ncbi:MAG: tetratricopeptide repeat protein [Pseudomonadota bacterium]
MDESTKQLLAQAKEYYANKEYDRAISLFLRVLDAGGGDFADIHHMLGQIYFDKGDFGRAQEFFEKAVRINPRYTDAILALSVTYSELGKYDEADKLQTFAQKQMECQPGSVDPFVKGKIANMHGELASAYVEAGMPDEAVNEYKNALKLCPNFPDLWTRLGHIHREMGSKADAKSCYLKAIEANSKFVPARIHLGLLMFQEGNKDYAVTQWKEVLSISPGNRSARMYLKTFAKVDLPDYVDVGNEEEEKASQVSKAGGGEPDEAT